MEKAFQLLYVYFRQDVKPAVGHKAAVGDQTVHVGVEIDQIADNNRNRIRRHEDDINGQAPRGSNPIWRIGHQATGIDIVLV